MSPTPEMGQMTALQIVSPGHQNLRSLPVEAWPEADRKAWRTACRPAERLKRGGAAGHLKPVTRQGHERHYGNFLGSLERNGLLRREAPAAASVTPENVDVYVAEAKARMSSTTVHVSICFLRRAARYMVPGLELNWLSELAKDLALVAQPRSKFDRLVLPERLIEELCRLGDRPQLGENPWQVVDRAFGRGDKRTSRRRTARQ
jgi:hypothetical protein